MHDFDIRPALEGFRLLKDFESALEIRSGHVNSTYRISCKNPDRQYILQRINTFAFKRPETLMENIRKVTRHLREKLSALGISPDRRVLHFLPAENGALLFVDGNGGCWRAYDYVDRASAYDRVEKPEHFREAGRAFGEFQKLLADFPVAELEETIPNFHDTPRRFDAFQEAIERDRAGRAKGVRADIEFFCERRGMMGEVVCRLGRGEIPLRVTHNDTKINNVLIDDGTGSAICVIDLDTVMPGSALYDFGDAIRFGAATAAEDEPDASKMGVDMVLFERFSEGFLSQVNGFLTDAELSMLPLSAKLITLEIAMRFLTDYLDGDRYFKIAYPEHNLVRARAQMALLSDMERKSDRMDAVVKRLIGSPCRLDNIGISRYNSGW